MKPKSITAVVIKGVASRGSRILCREGNGRMASLARIMTSNMRKRMFTTIADSPTHWKRSGNTVVLTLNRPAALNPLTEEMCLIIKKELLQWRKTFDVSCFVMKGNGKAFCAGGDIKALWQALSPKDHADGGIGIPGTVEGDFFRNEYEMNYLLKTSKVPQVSFWDGIVMGGGVGLSIYGEYRVATERTVFAMPECSIGIFPDVGSSSWIPNVKVPGMGLYMGLTGARLGARDLMETGLATHFISSDQLHDLEKDLIEFCPNSSKEGSYAAAARVVQDILDNHQHHNKVVPDDSRSVLKHHRDMIEMVFAGQQSIEEIYGSLESLKKSSADSTKRMWIEKTLSALNKQPPSSLKLTMKLFEIAEHRFKFNLEKCLEMEYRAMMRCMREPNFKEGIRATLIDKDGSPKWTPPTLAEVSDAEIDIYFDPLGDGDLDLSQYSPVL